MKKTVKKIACLMLSIVLVCCMLVPAFAKAKQTPIIVIPGVVNTPVYDSAGNRLFFPDFENNLDVEKAITALKHVLKLQESGNYEQAMTELLDILHDLFDPAMCDENGDSVRAAHCIKANGSLADDDTLLQYTGEAQLAKTIADYVGWKNVYVFSYDWRLDIIKTVDNELAPYIEQVKKETGSDKVRIIGSSMGGAVTNTYLTRYTAQKKDVEKVIFLSGAGQGVQFVNDIFSSETVHVNRPAVASYFKNVLNDGAAIGFSAISGYVSDIANNLMDSQYQTLWDDFAVRDLLCYPAFWELADHTPEMEKMLKKYKSDNFQKMIMEYYDIQDNIQDTLSALKDDGMDICYTSNYNLTGTPVVANADSLNTDYLIDTYHTSHGATVAELNKTLDDNYTQKLDTEHNHLSADGVIDASTCFLPETTWFIKNLVHVEYPYNSPQSKFITWLITNDNVDITSNEKYPQFLEYNKKANTLTPVTKVEIETAEEGSGDYISSAVTVYTYTQITALGWALIVAIAALLVILIVKKKGGKPQIEGVLSKKEIKALPKGERKAAKKQNKALTKEWKKEQKANKKARKAELKAMPKKERKAAIKADKAEKKAAKKQAKADKKAAKKQAKADKKAAKAEKKK